MAWSEEQVQKYQMDNNEALSEINKTLQGLTGKPIVGIFAPGQNGDAMVCSSVLKYKEELFPDKDIVWFCNYPVADFLRYSKEVNEVRPWLWAGNGLPEGCPDFYPLLCDENNRLNKEKAKDYELTKDLEDGYFPCPWMLNIKKRHGWEYSNCSKKVFGLPDETEWHPVINFSDEEKEKFNDKTYLFGQLGGVAERPIIAIESFCGSGQSLIDDLMIRKSMKICKEILGECNFIFMSHKYLSGNEEFPAEWLADNSKLYFAKECTVRQCALIVAKSDLMISVSSGISVAASCWENKNDNITPIIQFTGSKICSTQSLALGEFELVTYDNKPMTKAVEEFYIRLTKLLNSIK